MSSPGKVFMLRNWHELLEAVPKRNVLEAATVQDSRISFTVAQVKKPIGLGDKLELLVTIANQSKPAIPVDSVLTLEADKYFNRKVVKLTQEIPPFEERCM